MDCRAFFEELKIAHEERGLEFAYSYDGFYFGDFVRPAPQSPASYHHSGPKNLKSLRDIFRAESFRGDTLQTYQWYNPPINKTQKSRLFKDPSDMVYTLAWELSQRIGRLPDALHARMVLSADDHRCVRMYVAEWGA